MRSVLAAGALKNAAAQAPHMPRPAMVTGTPMIRLRNWRWRRLGRIQRHIHGSIERQVIGAAIRLIQ